MNQSDKSAGALDALSKVGLEAARVLLDSLGEMARASAAANPLVKAAATGCCEVPPACWLPRSLGELSSHACPCGTALIRLRVTNCQPIESTIRISVRSGSDLPVKIVPEGATLAPMERRWFTVAVTIPEDACKGQCHELLVWAVGCNEHYLRWTVQVSDGTSGSCQAVEVEDCPDYVHRWYDHFYCARPCFAQKRGDG